MSTTSFCVIYRFKVRAGQEDTFRDAWRRLTEAIRDRSGGLGSRLHRSDDGWWIAYAQWPDRAAWERARGNPIPADAEAQERMAGAIEERLPPLLLEPHDDLLVPSHGVPAR
jgi:quinol monooxygenase YgiN